MSGNMHSIALVYTSSRPFGFDCLSVDPIFREKNSWKWNERIPEEISIQDLTRPIYYNCRSDVVIFARTTVTKYKYRIPLL